MFNADRQSNVTRPGRETQGPIWILFGKLLRAISCVAAHLWSWLSNVIGLARTQRVLRRPRHYHLMRRIRARPTLTTSRTTRIPAYGGFHRVGKGAPDVPRRSNAPPASRVPCSAVTHSTFERRLALFSVPPFDVQALSAFQYDAATLVNQNDAHDNQPLSALDHPIVIDTGASVSVTPNPDDFVEGIRSTNMTELKGLNDVTVVRGLRTCELDNLRC